MISKEYFEKYAKEQKEIYNNIEDLPAGRVMYVFSEMAIQHQSDSTFDKSFILTFKGKNGVFVMSLDHDNKIRFHGELENGVKVDIKTLDGLTLATVGQLLQDANKKDKQKLEDNEIPGQKI